MSDWGRETAHCPCCDGRLVVVGSRIRFLIQPDGNKIWLYIRRLYCPHCNRIHHELPDMVMPYKRYSTQAVEEILSGTTSVPIPVACENSTMRRIRIWFFLLRFYFKSCLQSLKQLFQTDLSKSKLTPTNFYKIVLEQLGIHAGRSSAIAKQQLHEQLAVLKAVHDVSIQSELDHYNRAYTGQYVQCQLTYAGATSELFTEKAIDRIYEYSSGIARMIDKICTSVLIYGNQNRMRLIDDHAVAKVLEGEFS